MPRRILVHAIAATALCAVLAPAASAANPIRLYLSQGAAFQILGHSCGGIQEQVYATGFAATGYPTGDAYLKTSCGGSGRGGGYKSTTYTASASVEWTWFGETRSYATLSGPGSENGSFSAEDAHGDRVYNEGAAAYLATGEPPLRAPAAPTGVSASVGLYEVGETEYLRMSVTWSPDPATLALIGSSTVTAVPVGGGATLSATANGSWNPAYLGPVQPNTTYRVTVTSTDAEGTSQPSATVEITSPNSDGEAEREHKNVQACEQNQGTIALSPGLSETPAVQSITVKGKLANCGGPLGFEGAGYVAHLKTTEEVTCATLVSSSLEPTTTSVSFTVKWQPLEEGSSKGSLTMPLSEASLTGVTGTLSGGPFTAPSGLSAASLSESFKGAATCGQPQGVRKIVKPVKSGAFSTSEVEFG